MQLISKDSKLVKDKTEVENVAPGTLVRTVSEKAQLEDVCIVLRSSTNDLSVMLVILETGECFRVAPSYRIRILEGVTYHQQAPSQNFVDRHLLNKNR